MSCKYNECTLESWMVNISQGIINHPNPSLWRGWCHLICRPGTKFPDRGRTIIMNESPLTHPLNKKMVPHILNLDLESWHKNTSHLSPTSLTHWHLPHVPWLPTRPVTFQVHVATHFVVSLVIVEERCVCVVHVHSRGNNSKQEHRLLLRLMTIEAPIWYIRCFLRMVHR